MTYATTDHHTLALNNLQGALGRTSGRSYKAAPRQLLHVDSSNASTSPTTSHAHAAQIHKSDVQEGEGIAREAARMGREALTTATDGLIRRDPLTHREVLVKLEHLYDLVLDVEQRRRDQPPPEEVEEFEQWWVMDDSILVFVSSLCRCRTTECDAIIDQIFDKLMVSVPLETRYVRYATDRSPFTDPQRAALLIPSFLSSHLSRASDFCPA